jgi:hypothetical protein
LTSGCGKLLDHGRPADIVVKDKGSEAPHSLTSDTSNALAAEPSNTPAPTPESNKTASALSDTTDTGSPIVKISACAVAIAAIAVIAVVYYVGYEELLRKFANSGFVNTTELGNVNFSEDAARSEGYKPCFKVSGINCYFDCASDEWIAERPVLNKGVASQSDYLLLYKPNFLIRKFLKPLKFLLRKKFGMPLIHSRLGG